MRWILSVLRALRVVLMLLLLGLTVLLYILLETSYGLRLANTFLPLFLPFTLQIDAPRGALLDTMYADKVTYRDSVVDVEVTHGSLRLDALRLLMGEIKVNDVIADDVRVIILESAEPTTLTRAKLLENLTLPFSLKLRNSTLKHLLVGEDHQKPWVDVQNAKVSALMNAEPHFRLSAKWSEGQLNFIPDVPLKSANGKFRIDGKLPHYSVSFNAQLQLANEKNKLTSIVGRGDFSGLILDTVNLRQASNNLNAPMQVTWLPYFQWAIPKLTGKIHGYPINGHMAMRADGKRWQIDNSEIKLHDASLEIAGQYKQNGKFSFKLAIPKMETLIAGSKGRIFSEGVWTGTAANPEINAVATANDVYINPNVSLKRLEGHLNAKSLYPSAQTYWQQFHFVAGLRADQIHLANQSLDEATLNFDGAFDVVHAALLHAEIKNLQLSNTPIDSLIVDVRNKDAYQKASVALNWGSKKLTAVISGDYKNKIWQGMLEDFKTNFNVHLQKRNSILISPDELKINPICFSLNQANLCGDLTWQKDKDFNAKMNGKNIPITTLTQFFLPKQKVEGTFSLEANMTGDGHYIQSGDLHFSLSDGKLIDNSGDTPIAIPFRKSHMDVSLSQKGLSLNGDLNVLDQPPIRWQLLAPKLNLGDPNWLGTSIDGYLEFSTQHLAMIAKSYPQLQNMKGTLSADIKIKGTLIEPQFSGGLQLKQGELDVPSLGLHLKPIEFSAQAQNNKITYDGHINTNPGLINIQGYTDLSPNNRKTELQINGNAITVMRTTEYQVNATPELHLTWFNHLLNVEGQITIPSAQLSPIDLGDTVTLSNDVVFVDGKEKKEKTDFSIHSHVKIILGDKVLLNVKGLTARLTGAVDVQENENSAQTTGLGQINIIDGRYKAHGQDLKVRTGRAIFTGGSVTNPALYAEVIRTVSTYVTANNTPTSGQKTQQSYGALQSDVIVGARITGTVDIPQITFFSEPAGLTQSQILSYLVLGKGESSGSDFDTSILLNAISFLDIGGKESAATKSTLQKGLGLDELGLQSGQEYSSESQSLVNNTSLVLGKALSPKLFVDYSIGLIEPINILRIRYQFAKHFMLRSESSTNAQGIDVFYNIER